MGCRARQWLCRSTDSQLVTKEWLVTVWGLNRWNAWIGGLSGTLLTYQP